MLKLILFLVLVVIVLSGIFIGISSSDCAINTTIIDSYIPNHAIA